MPGRYVGTQLARGPPPRPLTDAEYVDFLEARSTSATLVGMCAATWCHPTFESVMVQVHSVYLVRLV